MAVAKCARGGSSWRRPSVATPKAMRASASATTAASISPSRCWRWTLKRHLDTAAGRRHRRRDLRPRRLDRAPSPCRRRSASTTRRRGKSRCSGQSQMAPCDWPPRRPRTERHPVAARRCAPRGPRPRASGGGCRACGTGKSSGRTRTSSSGGRGRAATSTSRSSCERRPSSRNAGRTISRRPPAPPPRGTSRWRRSPGAWTQTQAPTSRGKDRSSRPGGHTPCR
mmetsp:Transcript_108848/g.302593  ORF Transcript_108848/g.302593 Transcript_108848/m.302593 type:complete len:225 (-) Transcript_108848:56-730(-)